MTTFNPTQQTLTLYSALVHNSADYLTEISDKDCDFTNSKAVIKGIIGQKLSKLENISRTFNQVLENYRECQDLRGVCAVAIGLCGFTGGLTVALVGIVKGSISLGLIGTVVTVASPIFGLKLPSIGKGVEIQTFKQLENENAKLLDEITLIDRKAQESWVYDAQIESYQTVLAKRLPVITAMHDSNFFNFVTRMKIASSILRSCVQPNELLLDRAWELLEKVVSVYSEGQSEAKSIVDDMAKEKMDKQGENTSSIANSVIIPLVNAYLIGNYLDEVSSQQDEKASSAKETASAASQVLSLTNIAAEPLTPTAAASDPVQPATAAAASDPVQSTTAAAAKMRKRKPRRKKTLGTNL